MKKRIGIWLLLGCVLLSGCAKNETADEATAISVAQSEEESESAAEATSAESAAEATLAESAAEATSAESTTEATSAESTAEATSAEGTAESAADTEAASAVEPEKDPYILDEYSQYKDAYPLICIGQNHGFDGIEDLIEQEQAIYDRMESLGDLDHPAEG